MKTRRNPDFFMDLLTIGVLGFGGLWVVNQINHVGQQAGRAVASTIGAPVDTVGSSLNSALDICPSGHCNTLCDSITYWRQNVAPGVNLGGFQVFGFDPHDWNAFRAWTQKGGNFVNGMPDPGPNPPSCW